MIDTIIKGTGNSRSIRSVPNLAALAPTYDKLLELLTSVDGLPIDFGPLNLAGLDQKGNDLNKASLLTDDTAALYGFSSDATPNQVLAAIKPLIVEVDGKYRSASGSYAGVTPQNTPGVEKTLFLGFEAKLFLLVGTGDTAGIRPNFMVGCYPLALGVLNSGSLSISQFQITTTSIIITNGLYYNALGRNYYYFAIG